MYNRGRMTSETVATIRAGGRIRSPALKSDGYVERIEGPNAIVVLDNGDRHTIRISAGVIVPAPFRVGDSVTRRASPDGITGVVLAEAVSAEYPEWTIAWADGRREQVAEMDLLPAQLTDPVDRFRHGQIDLAEQFNLRSVAADLWARNRHDDLVSLSHARVDLEAYQVSVVHRVVMNYPHRFLLCDEVGLGKTIEAGMIIKELRARGLARRVLILAPAGIQRQWQFELKTKFNETFSIFNKLTLDSLRNQNVLNPWNDHQSIITSTNFAAWDEKRHAEIAAVPWDLIVVDEAHHARRQRRGTSFQRTKLYQLVHDLTARPEFSRRAVLFLTATPMQLQRHELFSLVEMLQPALFASESDFDDHLTARSGLSKLVERLQQPALLTGVEEQSFIRQAARFLDTDPATVRALLDKPDALAEALRERHRLSEVMIRNRRAVVGGFMPREAFRWDVELTEQEQEAQVRMDAIIREGYRMMAKRSDQRASALGFLMVIFQKLAASSSRALCRSLERRRDKLIGEGDVSLRARTITDLEMEEELESDTESAVVAEGPMEAIIHEAERLSEVIDLLNEIPLDSKARVLLKELHDLFRDEPDGKVLIFTEFRETQDMLADLLRDQGWGCNVFHGQLKPEEKDVAVDACRRGDGPQILVSTEAGGEGRNLQFSHLVINYDLPWNPMKIEQRIGRVDRKGQNHPVSVFNFHVKGTIESRILDVLEKRIHLFEGAIGELEPILGDAEASIRKALRQSARARDKALENWGKRIQRNIDEARQAAEKMQDFVLDSRSDYSAQISQLAKGRSAPVSQDEFERLLIHLLQSVRTWIGPATEGARTIQFHPPFTEEGRALLNGVESWYVCFDPHVDSDRAEYFGFGHPIVDALVQRVTNERQDGAAAIRTISRERVPGVRPGWQFNWRLTTGGRLPKESITPVFIGDDGEPDEKLAERLLLASREFAPETARMDSTAIAGEIDAAHSLSQQLIAEQRDARRRELSDEAEARYSVERKRIERLYDNKEKAARDKIATSEQTLQRLEASNEENERRVIPVWQANVRRDQAELEHLRDDRERALRELDETRRPDVTSSLLAVARIEVA